MSEGHEPLNDLEAELSRLRPRRLSAALAERVEARLDIAPAAAGRHARHYARWAVAAVACTAAVGIAIWLSGVGRVGNDRPEPPNIAGKTPQKVSPDPAKLQTPGWRIVPTGDALCSLVKPGHLRLERGELFVESVPLGDAEQTRPPLNIETPEGEAIATDTQFYIGTYSLNATEPRLVKGTEAMSFTRVLVLVGVVALTNPQGSVTGQANQLLAAESGEAPTNIAVTANGDFAIDLYKQLAKDSPGKNLFFSPYSMSSALAMTAEGARGETADQMGKVLRFPKAARHIGNDAQLIPWNTALIHTGIAALNDRFTMKPVPEELRDKIATLRKELEATNQEAAKLRASMRYKEFDEAARKSQKIAADLKTLLEQVNPYEIRVANALWGEKSYPFAKGFLDTINKSYRTGGLFPADFIHNAEAERAKINAWVEEQTNNRIKELVPKDGIDANTRLVLTNAIYFKGDWAEPFSEKGTTEENFVISADKHTRVPLMSRNAVTKTPYAAFNADGSFFSTPREIDAEKKDESKTGYPGAGGFLLAELPYKGGDLSMVVIVPQDVDGLEKVEQQLSSEKLQTWIGKLEPRPVFVYLPKFKLSTEYEMNEPLKALGMVRAFSDSADPLAGAQFDGMCASQDPGERLFISHVFHNAFVDVNETGTEAAAATAVTMSKGGTARPPFMPTFRADRPFLFAIRDTRTGTILFLGRMTNPNG